MFLTIKRDTIILGTIITILILFIIIYFSKIEKTNSSVIEQPNANTINTEQGKENNINSVIKKDKKIVIDAGHGGFDPGAVSENGTPEKDINLNISLKLQKELEEKGYEVIMTRCEDTDLTNGAEKGKLKRTDLDNRKEIINQSNADILISIHLNYFTQSQYKGMQTFYVEESEEGKKLAKCIQDNLQQKIKVEKERTILPIKSIYILEKTTMPAVVVECGFLSNPDDEQNLKKEEYQNKIAQAISEGIEKYFNK